MKEKLTLYMKALEMVRVASEALMKDEDFLPADMVDIINDIDASTYYFEAEVDELMRGE